MVIEELADDENSTAAVMAEQTGLLLCETAAPTEGLLPAR